MATDPRSDGPPTRSSAAARTCVGCGRRDDRSVLLRVVARRSADTGAAWAQPDTRQREPGRGAWLHCTPDCLERAIRRRAFARALRVRAEIDLGALTVAVRAAQDEQD